MPWAAKGLEGSLLNEWRWVMYMWRDLAARCWLAAPVALIATGLQAASLHDQVDKLFQLLKKPSYSSLQSAQEFYDALPAKDKQDWRLEHAFTLVLIKGHRYADASRRLEEAVRLQPDNLLVRRTRVWLELMLGNRAVATNNLVALGKSLGSIDAAEIEKIHKETAAFMGRGFAFLEGPAAGLGNSKVSVSKAKTQAKQLLQHDELLGDFERGEAEVADQFEMFRDEVTLTKQEVAKQQAEELDKQQRDLEEKKTALDKEREGLEGKGQERKDEATKEFDLLTAKADELESAYLALMAKAAPLHVRREAAREEIRLRTVVERREGSTDERVFINDPIRVQRLGTLIEHLDAQLALLAADASAIKTRLMTVSNKSWRTIAEHLADRQKIAAEQQKLDKKNKRLEGLAKSQSKMKATGNNSETRVMAKKLTTFSTYEPFEVEDEQAHILELCKE